MLQRCKWIPRVIVLLPVEQQPFQCCSDHTPEFFLSSTINICYSSMFLNQLWPPASSLTDQVNLCYYRWTCSNYNRCTAPHCMDVPQSTYSAPMGGHLDCFQPLVLQPQHHCPPLVSSPFSINYTYSSTEASVPRPSLVQRYFPDDLLFVLYLPDKQAFLLFPKRLTFLDL